MSNSWRPGKRVAIVGGGPGAVSAGLAFIQRGFDVRIYEKQRVPKAIGGAVLLSTPVLAILRQYGIEVDQYGGHVVTHFLNSKGDNRCTLPFNKDIERKFGIKGWHRGILRSWVFGHMLEKLPAGIMQADHEFESYVETEKHVELRFVNNKTVIADSIVGADGVRSRVSNQLFGESGLFHAGIRLYLAWCDQIDGIPPNYGYVSHDADVQASFFPMIHNGKPGFEWWIVESSWEGKPVPKDIKAHVKSTLANWCDPMPRFSDVTDFDTQVYRWEIYNRPAMKRWSGGRVICLGDAVHPVSPYAAYGMGMAIEDGYYIAKHLDGVDLQDAAAVTAGFELFEKQRIDYVNHNMLFARRLGYLFHKVPWPLNKVRDLAFDYTPILDKMMRAGYLEKQELETLTCTELQVSE